MNLKKTAFSLFFCLATSAFSQSLADLPEPYKSVNLLPFDGHGWYSNGDQMTQLFKERNPKIVIEIGSWLGASTRHIASLLPTDGVVYAVDHWLGSIEHQIGQHWHVKPLNTLYDQFLSNVIHAGLTDKIIPIRMASLDAVKVLNVFPDIIYIDAGHDYEGVYRDLTAWLPFVRDHGVLCGDDWTWETVRNAVIQFGRENNLRPVASGNFWYYK